jgi:ATP-dependent Clp protease ATP-binding subunit ClpA
MSGVSGIESSSVADRFDKFSERARRALQAAQEEAARLGHGQITADHLVLGVLRDPSAVARAVLGRLHVNLEELARTATSSAVNTTQEASSGLSATARTAIELAVDEARALNHHYVGTEHLLLGLVREGTNALAQTLQPRDEALRRTRAAIATVLNDPSRRPKPWRGSTRMTVGVGTPPEASPPVRRITRPGVPTPEENEQLFEHLSAFLADPTSGPTQSEAGLFGRLADSALQVLQNAYEEAQRLAHNYIGTEHILLGLAGDTQSTSGRLLRDLGAELAKVRDAVEFIIGRGDRPHAETPGLTPRARKVLILALEEADRLGHAQAAAEHLLLGIIREGEGIASGVLESLVVNTDWIRTQLLENLGQVQVPPTPARVSRAGRSALLQAQLVARWYYHAQVDTEHVLVGLVRERGVAARVLAILGVELSALLAQFEALVPADAGRPSPAGLGYTLAAQAAIERASWEAEQRGQPRAGSAHLLLGVLAIEGGQARDILSRLNVSPEAIRAAVEPLLSAEES